MRRILVGVCLLGAMAPASAQQPVPPIRMSHPAVLAGTGPSSFSLVQGNALDATNKPLPNARVRLRDARNGRVADLGRTDRTGLFAFRPVDPGSYVVELLGMDQSVLATSQLLNVNAGESVSTIVKLPSRTAPVAAMLGHTAAQASVIAAAAAAAGVLATEVTGAVASARQ
jgi:hypothetical protein